MGLSPDPTLNRRFYNPRIAALLLLGLALLGVFVLRLWDVQIVHGDEYHTQADQNRLRLESVAAPRGIIYDRTGVPLARNAPNFQVQIIPANLPDDAAAERRVLERLAALLD